MLQAVEIILNIVDCDTLNGCIAEKAFVAADGILDAVACIFLCIALFVSAIPSPCIFRKRVLGRFWRAWQVAVQFFYVH